MIENTPMVIDRYRTRPPRSATPATASINSLSDIAMMALGFLAARKLPPWAAVALLVALELVPLVVIRDNLTLNVWMLLWPNRRWPRGRRPADGTKSAPRIDAARERLRLRFAALRSPPCRLQPRLASCSAASTSMTSTRRSTASGIEGGVDFQLGWRGGRIGHTPLQPYVFGALNSAGETSYAAVGLSAKFGRRIYIRPGVGIAIHNGSAKNFMTRQRQDRLRQPRPVRAGARHRRPAQRPAERRGELGAHEPCAIVRPAKPRNRQSRRPA